MGGALLVASGLVACNAILGLNDFEKVDSLGLDASPDVVTVDGGVDSGPDTGPPPIPTGTAPTTALWARWPMPDSVQTGFGPSPGAKYTPSYGPDGGATLAYVTDNVTNLTWLKKVYTASTFTEAVEKCKAAGAASEGGIKDWRVPSRIELASILDHKQAASAPKIDPVFYERIDAGPVPPPRQKYWTGSVVYPVGSTVSFWVVDFDTGEVWKTKEASHVRCVRGAS